MKKYFYVLLAATMVLFAACKKDKKSEPTTDTDQNEEQTGNDDNQKTDEPTFVIEVEVDGITANVTVTASDKNELFYFDLIDKSDYTDTWAADPIAAADAWVEEFIEYENLLAQFFGGDEYTINDFIDDMGSQGSDSYLFDGLDPLTDYVVVAFYLDATGKAKYSVATKEFKTGDAPEPIPSDNTFTLSYADNVVSIVTSNDDEYWTTAIEEEYYNEYIEWGYTDADIILDDYENNKEYAQYFILSGSYEYDLAKEYNYSLESGDYYFLVAGISNGGLSTEVTKLKLTYVAPEISGEDPSDEETPAEAPAKVKGKKQAKRVLGHIKPAKGLKLNRK